jgi:hypothetical protein
MDFSEYHRIRRAIYEEETRKAFAALATCNLSSDDKRAIRRAATRAGDRIAQDARIIKMREDRRRILDEIIRISRESGA